MSGERLADVLVVAAHPPELAGLVDLLGHDLRGAVGEKRVVATAVGIGLPEAAAGTAMALQSYEPRCVVLIGTCGVYEPHAGNLSIAEVVTARRVHLASVAEVERRGAFPGPMRALLETDVDFANAVAGPNVRRVGIATTLAITTDDDLAGRVSDALGCEVEHLEAFGVAAACARYGVPLAVILGIANRVGGRARDEWVRHHEPAGRAAAEIIAAWLRAGAPGIKT